MVFWAATVVPCLAPGQARDIGNLTPWAKGNFLDHPQCPTAGNKSAYIPGQEKNFVPQQPWLHFICIPVFLANSLTCVAEATNFYWCHGQQSQW